MGYIPNIHLAPTAEKAGDTSTPVFMEKLGTCHSKSRAAAQVAAAAAAFDSPWRLAPTGLATALEAQLSNILAEQAGNGQLCADPPTHPLAC